MTRTTCPECAEAWRTNEEEHRGLCDDCVPRLSPAAKAAVQSVLDQAAARILAERVGTTVQ